MTEPRFRSAERSSLPTLANEHLKLAHAATNGRSAYTVRGGRDRSLRQTVLALVAGQRLDEHESPGEASVQVLRGRVRIAAGEAASEGSAGDLLMVPETRHTLEALEDAAVLLTVAKPRSAPDRSAPGPPRGAADG